MITRAATVGELLVLARAAFPYHVEPADIILKNGTGGALVEGDLVMLDMTSAGVDTPLNYIQAIAPTVAGNLKSGNAIHLVCQGSLADGARGKFRLRGDTKLNLNASSATIGTLLHTRGTNKDATTAVTWGGKCIGKTKVATTTGVVQAYFDGTGTMPGPEYFFVPVSVQTGNLTATTGKWFMHVPYAFTLSGLTASVGTAPAAQAIIIDVNENGTTVMAATKLSIDATETSSSTAASAAVISDPDIAADALLSIDVDQVGSGTTGANLAVTIFGYR